MIAHNFQDLTGKKFGRLTVLYRAEDKISQSGLKYIQWECQCDCGNTARKEAEIKYFGEYRYKGDEINNEANIS